MTASFKLSRCRLVSAASELPARGLRSNRCRGAAPDRVQSAGHGSSISHAVIHSCVMLQLQYSPFQRGLRGSNASERVCSIPFIEDLKNKFININKPSGLTPLLKLGLVLQQECRQVLDGVWRSGTQTGSLSADSINQSQCNYMTDPLTMAGSAQTFTPGLKFSPGISLGTVVCTRIRA